MCIRDRCHRLFLYVIDLIYLLISFTYDSGDLLNLPGEGASGHRIFLNYLFITYIVTSNPKRISVAAGLVHMLCFPLYMLIRYKGSQGALGYQRQAWGDCEGGGWQLLALGPHCALSLSYT